MIRTFVRTSVARRTRFTSFVSLASALVASVVALSAAPLPASAQSPAAPAARWEFLMSSGAVLPAGEQRDVLSNASLSTMQLSYVAHPAVAVTAMAGWARSRDLGFSSEQPLDLFSYDAGVEARAAQRNLGRAVTFRPFAGIGAGARSYNHRHLDLAVRHNAAAYAGVGGELGAGGVRVRLEARQYLTRFRPLAGGGGTDTRNEVALLAGLRLVSR
ncbi:MAG: hypothetical protein IT348_05535 [Candidatus Eisenbacteria bacterium]|nr:hypothetical protein [Candidatus Eisenbacteria bacterium]